MSPVAAQASSTTTLAALDNTVAIETPEHIRFRHYVAGPTRRFVAYILDWLVRLVLAAVIGAIVMLMAGRSDVLQGVGQGIVLLVLFVLEWVYFVLFETLDNGRSPGKRALRLRVVKDRGEPITFIDSVLRNLLRAADFLPLGYVLGTLAMVADGRFRRLGDRVAGTMVVIEQTTAVQAPIVLQPPARADELSMLPTRLPLSTPELEALDMFVRRAALSQARRVELAEMVSSLWGERTGVNVHDPIRFLQLLHVRAWGRKTAAKDLQQQERA